MRAQEIIGQCFRGAYRLGGGTTVGTHDLIDVFVWGISNDDHPETRPIKYDPLPKPRVGMVGTCSLHPDHTHTGGFWTVP